MKLFRGGKDAANPEAVDGAPAPPHARGSNNLVPALVLAVGLAGGGYFVSNSGGTEAAAAAKPTEAAHAKGGGSQEATHGPVQNLEPITLNLADGRFLKVGLALQLAESEGGEEGDELPAAKALDIAISLLGTYKMDELADPKDRELVKKKLTHQVAKAYVDPLTQAQMVTKVYFTEFVMQ